jgi:hypothetical protein
VYGKQLHRNYVDTVHFTEIFLELTHSRLDVRVNPNNGMFLLVVILILEVRMGNITEYKYLIHNYLMELILTKTLNF